MIIEPAKRTLSVKEYYFSIKNKEIARLTAERVARGEDPVINLGIGSPDGSPSPEAIEALAQCARRTGVHGYQSYVERDPAAHGFQGRHPASLPHVPEQG